MYIYSYNEIKNIIEQGMFVYVDKKAINLEKYDEDSLFFVIRTSTNSLNNSPVFIEVEEINREKINKLYEYLLKNKSVNLSDLIEIDCLDRHAYGLEHKGLVSIENEIVKLK